MTLLAPLGLLALLALPIIVLLHFRRERLRRIAVPSLLLWQQLEVVTGQKRRMRLPLTLLLLLHLLAALLLGLALTQPQWLTGLLQQGNRHIVVILDTSNSMAAREGSGSRLDQARNEVRGIIGNLTTTDRMTLITASSRAQLLTSGGGGNQGELLAALDLVQPGGTGTNLNEALTLAGVTRQGSTTASEIVVVSDLDPPQTADLPLDALRWVRVGGTTNNQAIVVLATRPRRGGSPGYDVYARVTNYDSQPVATTLSLYGDDALLETRDLSLEAAGEVELTWELPATVQRLRAELGTDDALTIDNTAELQLEQVRQRRIVVVAAGAPAIERALQAIDGVTASVVTPEQYASTAPDAADLTIFSNTVPETLPAGGVLLINPPVGETPLFTVNPPNPPQVTDPNAAPVPPAPIRIVPASSGTSANPLDGLSFGGIDFGAVPQVVTPDWARPLLTQGDTPLVLEGNTGTSTVMVWAFDPQAGNLQDKLAFPLLTARSVRYLTTPPPPTDVLPGERVVLATGPRTDRIELVAPDGTTTTLAVNGTVYLDGLQTPGLYRLTEYAGDAVVYEGALAVNAGNALESDLQARAMPLVGTPYLAGAAPPDTNASVASPPVQDEMPLWPWLALLALGVMVLEWIYVHWR